MNKIDTIKSIQEENIDPKSRCIYLFDDVSPQSSKQMVQNIHFLDSSSGDIHIYFNTLGGLWDDGLAMYNAIANSKNNVVGHVIGTCSSMGSLVLQACDTRKMYDFCSILIHPGSCFQESTVPDFIERARFEKKTLSISHQIYYNRMKKTVKDDSELISFKKFVNLISKDKYLFASQALKLGLIDEIER